MPTRRAASKGRTKRTVKSSRQPRPGRKRLTATDALTLLRNDHQEVSDLFDRFQATRAAARKQQIAERICRQLTVHAAIEEEIFYPAMRDALRGAADLLDEAQVEHASVKDLIGQIENGNTGDELFDARVTVLGEYVKHHVKEEQTQLFPKVRKSRLDLKELGAQLANRKAELMAE